MEKPFYTTVEAAAALSITAARVRQLILDGEMMAEKVGRDLLIPAEAIEQARQRKTKPGPETIMERLKRIGNEIVEESGGRYVERVVLPQAQDSNDWDICFRTPADKEYCAHVIRRASQTDDEIKKDILRQLPVGGNAPASKKVRAKKTAKKKRGGAK